MTIPEENLKKAPFPWFGGKRRVAPVVWAALGGRVNGHPEELAGAVSALELVKGGRDELQGDAGK
jgi:hypothetical protein